MHGARRVYTTYVGHARRVMSKFYLRSESELFLCDCVKWNSLWAGDIGAARATLKREWLAVKNLIRSFFFDDEDVRWEVDRLAKASAWYQVAYSPQEKGLFLCFPWIICDVLCRLKTARRQEQHLASLEHSKDLPPRLSMIPDSLLCSLGHDAYRTFEDTIETTSAIISRQQRAVSLLRSAVCAHVAALGGDATLKIFGSVALGLCESGSDVDVLVQLTDIPLPTGFTAQPNESQEKYLLECFVFPAVDALANSVVKVYDTPVPILKCSIGHEESGADISVDICMNISGRKKAEFLQTVFATHPMAYPAVYLLFSFARSVGIVPSALIQASGDKSSFLIKSADFHGLVLGLLKLDMLADTVSKHFASFDELLIHCSDKNEQCYYHWLGEKLIAFFTELESLKGSSEWCFTWPVDRSLRQSLTAAVIKTLAETGRSMRFSLLYSKSWSFALTHAAASLDANPRQFEIVLPRSTSTAVHSCSEFHRSRLEFLTGTSCP